MAAVLALALCAVLGSGQAKSYGKESVRIFVFTAQAAESTSPDEAQQARLSAVKELKDQLRHKAGLSIVDDRSQADVVIEVIELEERDAGDGGFGGAKLTPLVNSILRLHLTAGENQTDIKGMGPGSGSRAAKDAADRVLKWVVRNRVDRPTIS
jgi:hypothetical protein